jgi:hypothetical protein
MGRPACPLRARLAAVLGAAGPSQLAPDHLVERGRELAIPLLPGMQVHPGGSGGGVAHAVHQLSQRGARLTGQRVAGMAEIMNIKRRRCAAPGPALASASGLGEAPADTRRPKRRRPPLINQAHLGARSQRCTVPSSSATRLSRSRPPRQGRPPGVAVRWLRQPRPDVHSPGSGAYRGRRGRSRLLPGRMLPAGQGSMMLKFGSPGCRALNSVASWLSSPLVVSPWSRAASRSPWARAIRAAAGTVRVRLAGLPLSLT